MPHHADGSGGNSHRNRARQPQTHSFELGKCMPRAHRLTRNAFHDWPGGIHKPCPKKAESHPAHTPFNELLCLTQVSFEHVSCPCCSMCLHPHSLKKPAAVLNKLLSHCPCIVSCNQSS